MTVLLGGVIPCAEKCVLTPFKWFQICCCPDRPYACAQAARMHAHTHSHPQAMHNLEYLGNQGSTGQQHAWGFSAASFASDFLWHYATENKRQLLLLNPAALPPLRLNLTLKKCKYLHWKRQSTSLKNVTHNGLLCYCRSTQELPFLTARIWHSLTARCWTEKKFFVVPATLIKSRV